MHTDFYNLKEEPFNITPDPDFFYGSETHKEAFLSLVDGIQRRKGFMCLTGPVGDGKTMLSRSILPYIGPEFPSSMIFDPILTPLGLLLTILEDLDIKADPNPTMKSCHDALNASLMRTSRAGSTSVLIIDEAQHLKPDILEQIRLLSNFETNKEKLIQIILVGQPELNELLAKQELRQLRQRITVKCNLVALSRQETREYISHRIRVAGGINDLLFDAQAMDRIYDYAQGIPRIINVLCDYVLTKVEQEQTNDDDRSSIGISTVSQPVFDRAKFDIQHSSTLELVDSVAAELGMRVLETAPKPILIKTNQPEEEDGEDDHAQNKRELWGNPKLLELMDATIAMPDQPEPPKEKPPALQPVKTPEPVAVVPSKTQEAPTTKAPKPTLRPTPIAKTVKLEEKPTLRPRPTPKPMSPEETVKPEAKAALKPKPAIKPVATPKVTPTAKPVQVKTPSEPEKKPTVPMQTEPVKDESDTAPLEVNKILEDVSSTPEAMELHEEYEEDKKKEIGAFRVITALALLIIYISVDCNCALHETPNYMLFVRLLVFVQGFGFAVATAWRASGKKLALSIIIIILFLFHFNNNKPVLSIVEKIHGPEEVSSEQ